MIIFAFCPHQPTLQKLIYPLMRVISPGFRQSWQKAKILIGPVAPFVSLRMPGHPASLASEAPLALLFSPAAFGHAPARCSRPLIRPVMLPAFYTQLFILEQINFEMLHISKLLFC